MADESIISSKRPGFPKLTATAAGLDTLIEYVGEYATLSGAGVVTGATWGNYAGTVDSADLDPIEGTSKAILTVRMIFKWGSAQYGSGTGTETATVHEIEWADVQHPIYQHKVFRSGGTYALDDDDLIQIRRWEEMDDPALKAEWKFYTDDEGATGTLSSNAQKLAKGMLLGIEYYVEKAPVLRKSTFYLNGPPPQSGGGVKESPGSFPQISGLSGYEWLRSADRSLQTGTEKEWRRDQEWMGARKILVDAENIYWLPSA
jgi:hypothetical protein